MATTQLQVDAPPDAVFDVLADPRRYPDWVVGAAEVRAVDGDWPEPGSTFHHTQLLPAVGLKDTTSVIASNRPRQLVLVVRVRPLWVGKVELRLRECEGGTRVTMIEEPTSPVVGRLGGRLLDAAIGLRNRGSLRRLKALAEGTAPRPEEALPKRQGSPAA